MDLQLPDGSVPTRGQHHLKDIWIIQDIFLSFLFIYLFIKLLLCWSYMSLPGEHRAADRTKPAAASCTSRLPSHGGSSSTCLSSSASSMDTDLSSVLLNYTSYRFFPLCMITHMTECTSTVSVSIFHHPQTPGQQQERDAKRL